MKKALSLFLSLLLILGLSVMTVSAEGGTLAEKTVTLTATPDQTTICVGSTADVYVKYAITICSNDGQTCIPAFSFVLKDEKLATGVTDANWKYHINKEALMQPDELDEETENYTGHYKIVDYNPATGYVGVGGSNNDGIVASTEVMTTVAKFAKGSVTAETTYTVSPTDFIAGAGDTYTSGEVKIANQFGTRTVAPATITVKPGATISGTLMDSTGQAALTGITSGTVEMYSGSTKVADGTLNTETGTYSFSDVSTGSYTVKAAVTAGGKQMNGSLDVTVAGEPTVSGKNVTVQQYAKGDVNMDGAVNSDDVTALLRHVSKIESLSAEAEALGNVNGDSAVNSDDVTKLLRFVSKIDQSLD